MRSHTIIEKKSTIYENNVKNLPEYTYKIKKVNEWELVLIF